MIRVNLLPQKREAGRRAASSDTNQSWLALVLAAVVLMILGLFFFHQSKNDELANITRRNQKIEADIAEVKRQISNHAEVKSQLQECRDRDEAKKKLEAARTGPTSAMLELSRVLTPGRGPTTDRDRLEQLKRDNPGAVPNPNWDPRRLWLTQYQESERVVRVSGLARDGEDVAEFLRRLTLSDYFYEVRPLPAAEVTDNATKIAMKKFELSAKVKY